VDDGITISDTTTTGRPPARQLPTFASARRAVARVRRPRRRRRAPLFARGGGRLRRMRYYRDFVVDLQRFHDLIVLVRRRVLLVHDPLGDDAVRRVHVILELLVHAEGGRAHRALVREVRRLQGHVVVAGHVVQQLPLVDLQREKQPHRHESRVLPRTTHPSADRTPAGVLALVGGVLHARRDEAVRAQQVALQSLIGEESKLALLAV
jgi:hypothetical protein